MYHRERTQLSQASPIVGLPGEGRNLVIGAVWFDGDVGQVAIFGDFDSAPVTHIMNPDAVAMVAARTFRGRAFVL